MLNNKIDTTPVAIDSLGRKLPTFEEVGPRREGKYVGVFYYIWQGTHGDKVYDITKILAEKSDNPKWGPAHAYHFWGEPEEGYYRAEDPWVIRRNLQMLSQADIDFIYFDVTNTVTYLGIVGKVCEISLQMRSEGIHTPLVCFTTASSSGKTINKIYNEFYKKDLYKDLWFCWQGKPLIMGDKNDAELLAEAKEYFTIKYSWAATDTVNNPNHWQWLDWTPQRWGWTEDPSIPEQITVSTAFHPANPHGKSYTNGKQPPVDEDYMTEFTGQGLFFAEQWERALEVDPQVVMVTQWNEWIAMRFIWDKEDGEFAGRPINKGGSSFVDVFNEEFNRDIAPMKGGHTDCMYYQLISNVRKFKGMDKPVAINANGKISIGDDFSKWSKVSPVYHDPKGDTMHRDFRGYDPAVQYTNSTGRNDIVESRIAYDADNIYFYVKTEDEITPYTDKNWMHLYIDADCSKKTGWEGYDFAVNIDVIDSTKTTLSQFISGEWKAIATVEYKYDGNQMQIALPRKLISQFDNVCFEFKWADNPQVLYDITEFFLNGDTAPDRRSNYSFQI